MVLRFKEQREPEGDMFDKKPENSSDFSEQRRVADDRRSRPTRPLEPASIGLRRRDLRRTDDQGGGYYVDWYEPSLLYLTLATIILSSLDAALTLQLLRLGATEINPFMDLLIRQDIRLFVTAKLTITSASLLFLVIHHKFRLFGHIKVRHLLYGILSLYSALIVYELSIWPT